jgi:hypothetical protein
MYVAILLVVVALAIAVPALQGRTLNPIRAPHLTKSSVVCFALLALLILPHGELSAEDQKDRQNILLLVDRSPSIEQQPHYQEALINQMFEKSRLTQGRLSLSVIFFGQSVEPIGEGPDGLPTPASEVLRQACAEQLAKPCAGGTPLPIAQEKLNKILSLTQGQNTTVVVLSDGVPTLPMSPELFPAVRKAMDDGLAKAAQSGEPNAQEKFMERLNDPNSEESKAIYEIQRPLVMQRCIQLAKNTNRFNPRIVSIAFAPGLKALKDIHVAAGGSEEDYIETTPENSLMAMHEASLVSGLINYPVVEMPASDDSQFRETFELAGELNAETVVTAQFTPTSQVLELANTGLQIKGQDFLAGTGENGVTVSRDSEQRLATFSMLTPVADGGTFLFNSEKEELAFPGAKLFRVIELPDDLNFVCRPKTFDTDQPTPYEIVQQNVPDFLVGLQWRNGDGVELSGGEVVFKHMETGQQHLIALREDDQFQNLLLAAAPKLIPGAYSVVAQLTLRSGLPISTTLEKQFIVVGECERVRVDVTETSFSIDQMDFGSLGDDKLSHIVNLRLASDTSFDLPLILRIVDLKDSLGVDIGEPWVELVDKDETTLPAGETIEIAFECKLPQNIPEEYEAGAVTGTLEILNADTLQPVEIVPAVEGAATVESLASVRFTLVRPELVLSAPRAWRDLISYQDGISSLFVNANVSFPYGRNVVLNIGTTSAVDREVRLRLGQSRKEDGSASDSVSLSLEDQFVGEPVIIPAGETLEVLLPLSVLEAEQRGEGSIIVSGPGLRFKVINFDVGSGSENGTWMSAVIWFVCAVFVLLALRAFLQKQDLSKYCRKPKALDVDRYSAGQVLKLFSFFPEEGQVLLKPVATGTEMCVGLEDSRLMENEEFVPFDSSVTIRSPDQREIEITNFSPDGKMCWAKVLSGGPKENSLKATKTTLRTSIAVTAMCCVLAIGIRHSRIVIELVQFAFDALYLS